jgi:hypothetical protein
MGKMKDDITERINGRMDVLQRMMENNQHLSSSSEVIDQIASITPYWSIMSEEDREYIQVARVAIEDQLEWKV